jgi:hypothetical protein
MQSCGTDGKTGCFVKPRLPAQRSFGSLELAVKQNNKTQQHVDEYHGVVINESSGRGDSDSRCSADQKTVMAADRYNKSERASQPYNIQRDLNILNEIPRAVWISNFDSVDTRFVWGNHAALSLWDKPSLKAFTSTDIMSGRSIAIQKTHHKLYQDVQVHLYSGTWLLHFDLLTTNV